MAEAVYSKEQVERWQKNLEQIAQEPRTTFTKKQAVEALIDTIEKALLTRSYDEVAGGLKDWGLDISAGSLKQYVTRYRRAHPAKPGAGRPKRAAKVRKKKTVGAVPQRSAHNGGEKQPAKRAKAGSQARAKRLPEPDDDLANEFNL